MPSGSYPMGDSAGGYPPGGGYDSGDGYSADGGYPGGYSETPDYPMGYDASGYPGYDASGYPGGEDYAAGMPGYGMPGGRGPGMGGSMLPPPRSLREQAIDALRDTDYDEGFRLLNMHYAVAPGGAEELTEMMAWFAELRRPALGPKIGIVVFYDRPPRDFEGTPMPIGSKEAEDAVASLAQPGGSGERGGRRTTQQRRGQQQFDEGFDPGFAEPMDMGFNEGMMGSGPGGPGGRRRNASPEEALKQLEFHTGELGTKLLTAINDRVSSGQYGRAYQEMIAELAKPAEKPRQNFAPGSGMPGYDDGGGYEEMMRAQMAGGAGGPPGPGGMMPGGPGGPGQRGGAAEQRHDQPMPLALAVTWLGKASSKDELDRLRAKADCDVLVTYEITVRPTPRIVTNITKIRVTNLRKEGEGTWILTAGMENRTILQERQKGARGEDPVDRQIARALELLDRICQPSALPPVFTEEVVKRRVASLVGASHDDPLPALVETRYYVAKELFPEEEYLSTAIALMGEAEFAELVRKVPDAGLAQFVGSAYSLPGLLNAVRGVNFAASTVTPQKAKDDPKQQTGRGLLPFNLPGFGSGSGSGAQPPGRPPQGRPPQYPGP